MGTIYGGDGRTNFALPDLRGRLAMHWGSGSGLSTRQIGQKGGAETATLNATQMPQHHHALACNSGAGGEDDPDGLFLGEGDVYATSSNATMNSAAISNTGANTRDPNKYTIFFKILLTGGWERTFYNGCNQPVY